MNGTPVVFSAATGLAAAGTAGTTLRPATAAPFETAGLLDVPTAFAGFGFESNDTTAASSAGGTLSTDGIVATAAAAAAGRWVSAVWAEGRATAGGEAGGVTIAVSPRVSRRGGAAEPEGEAFLALFLERCLLPPGAALALFFREDTEFLPPPVAALEDLAESLAARALSNTDAHAANSSARATLAVVIACDETSRPDLTE